jgi:hypothetical protein
MNEPTPKSTSERLRVALRLRLSVHRAGNGRQSKTVFAANSTRAPVLREPGPEDTDDRV